MDCGNQVNFPSGNCLAKLFRTDVATIAGPKLYDAEDNPLVLLEERNIAPLLGDVLGLKWRMSVVERRHGFGLRCGPPKSQLLISSEGMLQRARDQIRRGRRAVFIRHDLTERSHWKAFIRSRAFAAWFWSHIADLKISSVNGSHLQAGRLRRYFGDGIQP